MNVMLNIYQLLHETKETIYGHVPLSAYRSNVWCDTQSCEYRRI